jgi:hypothetical protein
MLRHSLLASAMLLTMVGTAVADYPANWPRQIACACSRGMLPRAGVTPRIVRR